ncbi:hypothetical protein ACOMHN_040325 [Nucella lapillus]
MTKRERLTLPDLASDTQLTGAAPTTFRETPSQPQQESPNSPVIAKLPKFESGSSDVSKTNSPNSDKTESVDSHSGPSTSQTSNVHTAANSMSKISARISQQNRKIILGMFPLHPRSADSVNREGTPTDQDSYPDTENCGESSGVESLRPRSSTSPLETDREKEGKELAKRNHKEDSRADPEKSPGTQEKGQESGGEADQVVEKEPTQGEVDKEQAKGNQNRGGPADSENSPRTHEGQEREDNQAGEEESIPEEVSDAAAPPPSTPDRQHIKRSRQSGNGNPSTSKIRKTL